MEARPAPDVYDDEQWELAAGELSQRSSNVVAFGYGSTEVVRRNGRERSARTDQELPEAAAVEVQRRPVHVASR